MCSCTTCIRTYRQALRGVGTSVCCRRCLEPHVPPLLKRVCTRSTQLISTTSGGTERSTQPISTTSGGAERGFKGMHMGRTCVRARTLRYNEESHPDGLIQWSMCTNASGHRLTFPTSHLPNHVYISVGASRTRHGSAAGAWTLQYSWAARAQRRQSSRARARASAPPAQSCARTTQRSSPRRAHQSAHVSCHKQPKYIPREVPKYDNISVRLSHPIAVSAQNMRTI